MKYGVVKCGLLLLTGVALIACEGVDWGAELEKVSFVQVEVEPNPVFTEESIELKATMRDVESDLEPPTEYGHVYTTEDNLMLLLGDYPTLEALRDEPAFILIQGDELDSRLAEPERPYFSTIVSKESLDEEKAYVYRAYAKWVHKDTLVLSKTYDSFALEQISVDIEGTPKVDCSSMSVRTASRVNGDENLLKTVTEYGYRVYDNQGNQVDQQRVEGSLSSSEFTMDVSLFELGWKYEIQPYLIYKRDAATVPQRVSGGKRPVQLDCSGPLWINTAEFRENRPGAIAPPAMNGAVRFVDEENNVYIGLGKGDSNNRLTEFWKFDPHIYTWERAGMSWDFADGLEGGINLQSDAGYYIGFGSTTNSIYRKSSSNSDWQPAIGSEDFKDALGGVRIPGSASQITIDDEFIAELLPRTNAFAFVINGRLYFGGGQGLTFNRVLDVNPKHKEGPVEKRWLDFNKNGKIDGGQWVDINGNGKIDTYLDDFVQVVGGETQTPDVKVSYGVDGAEHVMVEVIRNPNGEMEEFVGEYDVEDPPVVHRSEWRDDNKDKNIDYSNSTMTSELDLDGYIKNDLWSWDGEDPNSLALTAAGDDYQRYGATVVVQLNVAYITGGFNASSTAFAENTCYSPNGCTVKPDLATNGYGFAIAVGNEIIYFGGGEDEDGLPLPIDIQFVKGNDSAERISGCGLQNISRGQAFATKDGGKVFVGMGVERENEQTKLTDELWMYIPGN